MDQSRRPVGPWLVALLIVLVAAGVFWYMAAWPERSVVKPAYFTYSSEDIAQLKKLKSDTRLAVKDARRWEEKAFELIESHASIDVDASKVYAYLAVAQQDALALSYKAHGKPVGSFALVSKDVLCLMYPDSCSDLTAEDVDSYNQTLSTIITARIKTRIAADAKQTKPSVLKTGNQYWQGPAPQIGIEAASFKPWHIASADQFRAAPPPAPQSAEQKEQLALVKQALAQATTEQKATVVQWAGGPGTITPPGQWLDIASQYMQDKKVSVETFVRVRADMTTAMADAVIAVFDSKYAYQYKRPNMFDPSIVTIMPTPNHPSYPAGHATISWAAATVLDHYFSGNQKEWDRLAKEATDSRTLGGIHFPMDNAAGTTIGKQVGAMAVRGK